MADKLDREYLSRPLIQGTEFLIEGDRVKIAYPNTVFAEVQSITPIVKSELLTLYTKVRKNSKECGAKISYKTHIRREITQCWAEYENSCIKANKLFSQIIEQAKIIQSRGIHGGTVYDRELEKLYRISGEYQSLFYGNTVISKISGIYHRLKAIEKDLSVNTRNIIQIYL